MRNVVLRFRLRCAGFGGSTSPPRGCPSEGRRSSECDSRSSALHGERTSRKNCTQGGTGIARAQCDVWAAKSVDSSEFNSQWTNTNGPPAIRMTRRPQRLRSFAWLFHGRRSFVCLRRLAPWLATGRPGTSRTRALSICTHTHFFHPRFPYSAPSVLSVRPFCSRSWLCLPCRFPFESSGI